MTMYATREGQKISIHGNLGLDVKVHNGQVSEFHVSDPAGLEHVRSLWGSLGRLLGEADAEREQESSVAQGPGQ